MCRTPRSSVRSKTTKNPKFVLCFSPDTIYTIFLCPSSSRISCRVCRNCRKARPARIPPFVCALSVPLTFVGGCRTNSFKPGRVKRTTSSERVFAHDQMSISPKEKHMKTTAGPVIECLNVFRDRVRSEIMVSKKHGKANVEKYEKEYFL